MTHPAIASSTTGFGAVLTLTAALFAAQAHANITVYQDNCNGNDFSSRYTFNSAAQYAGYSSEFPPASESNMALADTVGAWNSFQTTSAHNGNFTDTTYSLTLSQFVKGSNNQQQLSITLLNNGYNTTALEYNGYRFYLYINTADTYFSGLSRVNQDGTTTSLVNVWSNYFDNSKVINAWSDLTLNVETTTGATNLSLVWSGVQADGTTPYSYTVLSYSDTSADRYTSGSGLGFGLQGASNGNGYFLDNLTVTAVPEPAGLGLLALGGLALLRRRRN